MCSKLFRLDYKISTFLEIVFLLESGGGGNVGRASFSDSCRLLVAFRLENLY